MDIQFTEKDNMNPYNQNGENYWEQNNQVKQSKKKKISFNDILTNMSLSVNNEGVLQYMTVNKEDEQPKDYKNVLKNINIKSTQSKNTEPLDSAVKHSYIYNKYFKDYSREKTETPEIRVPKTMEEYRQMLLEDRIKAIQHKKMIEEVKSKKMFFTSAPNATFNPRNIQSSVNNLRTMNFK